MDIKTIRFERSNFDNTKYNEASKFQRKFLNDSKALELEHNIFSLYAQLTDDVPDVIDFANVQSNDYFYEMSTFQFYALADRSWIKDKNIIVTNLYEPWIIGIPFDDQLDMMPKVFDDPTLFDCVHTAKSFTICLDNSDPRLAKKYPDINWVCPNMWHSEAFLSFTDEVSILRTQFVENVNMLDYIDEHTHKNKPHDFTCLIGKIKPHRLDFWFSLINNSLVEHNIVGSWDKHIINPKYEIKPNQEKDRVIKQEWIEKSKVWISLESFPEQNGNWPITQITEKTFKPIRYGMPFIVHGSKHTLQTLEDMGYDSYRSVFGDYIRTNYQETNKYIIDILKNVDTYDWDKIKDIAKHNVQVLQKWDKEKYFKSILKQIK